MLRTAKRERCVGVQHTREGVGMGAAHHGICDRSRVIGTFHHFCSSCFAQNEVRCKSIVDGDMFDFFIDCSRNSSEEAHGGASSSCGAFVGAEASGTCSFGVPFFALRAFFPPFPFAPFSGFTSSAITAVNCGRRAGGRRAETAVVAEGQVRVVVGCLLAVDVPVPIDVMPC